MEVSNNYQLKHQGSELPSDDLEKLLDESTVSKESDQMPYRNDNSLKTYRNSIEKLWKHWTSIPNQNPLHFLILCFQVFFYFIGYGYLQELLFTLPGFGPTAWFLTCYQFLIYSGFSFLNLGVSGVKQRRASYQSYFFLAFLTVSTMGLSNYSVGYLNYPTQVMFKCCKLIPVLVGGILIQRKVFNRYDVAAAICMSIGLIFFTLADSKVRPNFNLYGVTMISLALVADAIIGNYQEKIMKTHHVPNVEMVFFSFMFGFFIVLTGLLLTNNLLSCIAFWNQNIMRTYGYGFIFATFGYLGIDIVLTLIKEYGALICVTVTTCRKAITIILSFLLFSKPFVFDYVWSGVIVVFGIYLNVYSRNQAAFNTKLAAMGDTIFSTRWFSQTFANGSGRTLPV